MSKLTLMTLLTLAVAGCGLLPDHSLDYQQARNVPPLQLPDGQSPRTIQPLYPIPEVQVAPDRQAVVVEGQGRSQRFVAPPPKPLLKTAVAEQPQTPAIASKPVIVGDGNAHPMLQISGDMLKVWDNLAAALKAANIRVTDRNQSLGLYFVELTVAGKKSNYQVKLTRTNNDNLVSLQKDDDTVAESDVSQSLFESLLKSWPQ